MADDETPEPSPLGRRVGVWLREHSKHALVVAVAAAFVGAVTPVVLTGALKNWLAPDPPPTCPGAGCDGKSPQKEGCAADAVTWRPKGGNPVALHVRYSKHCEALWGRIINGEVGDVVTIRVQDGSARSGVISYGHDKFTPMVSVGATFKATACAEPTTSASRTGDWSKYCVDVTERTAWK